MKSICNPPTTTRGPSRHAPHVVTFVCSCLFLLAGLMVGAVAWAASGSSSGRQVVYQIRPSEADKAISRFDEPSYVTFNQGVGDQAQLVVFLPGSNGKPANAARLLGVIANQAYRVIGLEYNDSPAVVQVCRRDPNPACSGQFRHKRIFGDDVTTVVDDTPAESIVNRLVMLLAYLDKKHPEERWDGYLVGGQPNWQRIVVSGLSQGAGMAAYIAKRKVVARVVLFSSPWDFQAPTRTLAPWIAETSVTPPERWYAEYHRREKTAPLIAQAYRALRIPADHVRVFDLDLPAGKGNGSNNPFHGSTIRLPGYLSEWQFLFGQSP